jgi:putative tricarboxylic transport membrane protein
VRLDRVDRWLGPGLALTALVWLWLCYAYIPGARSEGEPGPRAFPVLLGIVLAGLGLAIALSAFAASPSSEVESTEALTHREARIVAATFGLLMLYPFLLDKLGFLIATPAAVLLALHGVLRVRGWLATLSLAAGLTSVCWLFFVLLLKAPLPRGAWFL